MKTTYRPSKKKQSTDAPKRSWFWNILGGEFLISPNLRKWYPYFILIFFMIGCIVVSERSIRQKKRIIHKKEIEYKEAITQLKNNNKFIPYEYNQELIEMMEEQGFRKDDQVIYKIIVEN